MHIRRLRKTLDDPRINTEAKRTEKQRHRRELQTILYIFLWVYMCWFLPLELGDRMGKTLAGETGRVIGIIIGGIVALSLILRTAAFELERERRGEDISFKLSQNQQWNTVLTVLGIIAIAAGLLLGLRLGLE